MEKYSSGRINPTSSARVNNKSSRESRHSINIVRSFSADKASISARMHYNMPFANHPYTGPSQNFVTFGLNNAGNTAAIATTKNNSCQLEHQVIIEEIQRPIKIYEEEDPTLKQLSMHNHEPDAPIPVPSGSPSSQSRNTQRELGVEGRIFS